MKLRCAFALWMTLGWSVAALHAQGDGLSAPATSIQGGLTAPCFATSVISYTYGTGTDDFSADNVLGPRDGQWTTLGSQGVVVLKMGGAITDQQGSDLTVYEYVGVAENYRVDVSTDGSLFTSVGECGGGICQFDIAPSGLSNVRYLRIADLLPNQGSFPDIGADIDAVEATQCNFDPVSAPGALQFFNGVVALPSATFTGLTDFTFEFWAFIDVIDAGNADFTNTFLSLEGSTANYVTLGQANDGRIVLHFLGSGRREFSPPVSPKVWHHLALVRQGAALTLYVDGVGVGTLTVSAAQLNVAANGALLGQEQDCAGGCFDATQSLRGRLDEVRLWSRALSVGELRQMMHACSTGGEPGIRAFWRFDDGLGQVAIDTTGNGYDGTLGTTQSSDSYDPTWVTSNSPVCGEIVDPNPHLLNGPNVTADADDLATYGRTVSGMVADGVTPIVIRHRLPAPGTAEFRITDENGLPNGVGNLRTPGGTEYSTTLVDVPLIPLSDGSYGVFAILTAPAHFVRTPIDESLSSRSINVEVEYDPAAPGPNQVFTHLIQLWRPPVMLLHGIWANRKTCWGWDLPSEPRWSLLSNANFTVYAEDYSGSNASSFKANANVARNGVSGALQKIRVRGIAATQADVFGHSMGGLLLRNYVSSSSYRRIDNFGGGDIHKLITVDTPHAGTRLANVGYDVVYNTNLGPYAARAARKKFCITCGAVADLREGVSPISELQATLGPAHAVVGKGGSDMLGAGLEESLPPLLRSLVGWSRHFKVPVDGYIFPTQSEHDIAVLRSSQEGGLAAANTSVFGYASAVNRGVHIDSVTREPQVGERAIELLNASIDDDATPFASGFPAPSTLLHIPNDLRTTGISVLSGGIVIIQPQSGAIITAGQPLPVTVESSGGFVASEVLVSSEHDMKLLETGPFTTTLDVPADAVGAVTISASAFDINDTFTTADDVVVQVQVTAALTAITGDPSSLDVFSFSGPSSIRVVGHYSDGVDRDVTSAASGTTYESADPNVAAVSSEGAVTGQSLGSTFVRIFNGSLTTAVEVQVVSVPLRLSLVRGSMSWPTSETGVAYDVVQGDLTLLRSSRGDFSIATTACLADDTETSSLSLIGHPNAGQGVWFLVRKVYPGGPTTYDTNPEWGSTSQVGERDSEIDAAANACP